MKQAFTTISAKNTSTRRLLQLCTASILAVGSIAVTQLSHAQSAGPAMMQAPMKGEMQAPQAMQQAPQAMQAPAKDAMEAPMKTDKHTARKDHKKASKKTDAMEAPMKSKM